MNGETLIYHDGIVQSAGTDRVFVRILSQSACSSCHSKSLCSALDIKEKIIEIETPEARAFTAGEAVTVSMAETSGWKAVVLAYFLPFVILMTVLVAAVDITGSEMAGGLAALGILIPYYWMLYILRKFIKKNFIFSVAKMHHPIESNIAIHSAVNL